MYVAVHLYWPISPDGIVDTSTRCHAGTREAMSKKKLYHYKDETARARNDLQIIYVISYIDFVVCIDYR